MCRQGYIADNSRRHNNLYCAYELPNQTARRLYCRRPDRKFGIVKLTLQPHTRSVDGCYVFLRYDIFFFFYFRQPNLGRPSTGNFFQKH